MGIILNRRRVCGGKDEGIYIQDGLVFWLDGINKGDDPTAWTDLIGGVKYAYNAYNTINVDNVHFGTIMIGTPGNPVSPVLGTIEVVFLSERNNGIIYMPAGGIAFGLYYDSVIWSTSKYKQAILPYTLNTIATSSINEDYNILNGNSYRFEGSNYWDHANVYHSYIGGRAGSTDFYGNVYCIRIYNRRLSLEEILHNQRIDNARFNLGLNI